jgi:hypothetical protein
MTPMIRSKSGHTAGPGLMYNPFLPWIVTEEEGDSGRGEIKRCFNTVSRDRERRDKHSNVQWGQHR